MEPKTVRRVFQGVSRPARHVEPDQAFNALVAGTVVLTLEGALPVEYLSPGDRVITRDSGVALLQTVRRMERTLPCVAVAKGALGHNRPDVETILLARQEVLVRDWRARALFDADRAMVPAARLCDGEFVRPVGACTVALIALEFDTPHVIYADGLEVASAQPLHAG